jgi:hypothetical protein
MRPERRVERTVMDGAPAEDAGKGALTMLFVRLPHRAASRGRQRPAPWLLAAFLLFAAPAALVYERPAAVQGSILVAAAEPRCERPPLPADDRGTVLSLSAQELVLDAGNCRLELALAPASIVPDELAAGDRIVAEYGPGVLAGTHVLIRARRPLGF